MNLRDGTLGVCGGLEFGEDLLDGYGYGLFAAFGKAHADGLLGIDGDGVEDDLVCPPWI